MSIQFLIRLVQGHESFRLAEIEALSRYVGFSYKVDQYERDSPFCIIVFENTTDRETACQVAAGFVSRSILSFGMYELWGTGDTYEQLHQNVQLNSINLARFYDDVSFKFSVDAFRAKRSTTEQRKIIESFSYLAFTGRIDMKHPQEEFVVFEEWSQLDPEMQSLMNSGKARTAMTPPTRVPARLYLGRKLALSQRHLMDKHDLKKRPYISTTSMDAELALVTAVLALAGPGKLFLDPFVGTGGFMVAAAELGAVTLGSDIDGRSFRGRGLGVGKGVGANFQRYGLTQCFGDCLTADLTNTPLRMERRWLDGIVCDPPYGVREGLKVLGRRLDGKILPEESDHAKRVEDGSYVVDDQPSHTLPGFVAPKRPYSFDRMLDDILDFASKTLVDEGRLAFWMPCANEIEEEFRVPQHHSLRLLHVCTQEFNKWSRRLLVYERIKSDIDTVHVAADVRPPKAVTNGHSADALNQFRRRYFQGFANGKPNGT